MNDVTITEEQLESLSCFVYGGFYDEYEYNAAKELFVQIRKQLLSEALEESYKNGFNDGQAEGMPEALRAERERVLDAVIQIINNNCYTLEGARLKNTPLVIIRNIESLRSEP